MDIELPNGVIIEGVPEGTSKDEVMRKAISMGLAKEADFAEPVTQQQIESDVPMPPEEVSALSPEQQTEYFGTQERPERTIGERIGGGVEAGASAVSGMTSGLAAGALGGLYGIGRSVVEGTYGTPEAAEEAARTSERWANAATIKPVTEAGQEAAQAVAEVLGPVGQVATALSPMATSGLGAMTRAAMPQVETMAQRAAMNVPRFERAKISQVRQALKENTTESVGWKLKGDKPVPNMLERDLLDLGVEDKTITTMRKLSKQPDKAAALKMLDAAEGFVKNKEGSELSRPSAVAGAQIMKRFDLLKEVQDKASKKIGAAVQKDLRGKPVDVTDIKNNFASYLDDQGATISDGRISFKDLTGFEAPDKKLLNETYRMLSRDSINADELHRVKKALSDRLSYDRRTATPLSGNSERLLKGVRSEINQKLRDMSDNYAKANDDFAKAASGLKPFEEALGRKFDPESARVENFTGTQLRKVLSNYANADELVDAVKNINDIANDFGGNFGNEIIPLVRLNSDLEGMLGSFAPQSLQGVVEKAGGVVGQRALGGMAEMAQAGMEAAKRRTSLWDAPVSQKVELINKLREQVKAQ